jgi:SAM-dependent methyltransferase
VPAGSDLAVELPDVLAGRLPSRYAYRMQDVFLEYVGRALRPGTVVLDVGGGRCPCVPVALRPEGVVYVGIDLSVEELSRAPTGSYDETIVADVTYPLELSRRPDLIVSWQVFEHLSPLADALENLRAVLRPGGAMIAQTSGTFALFALAARAMPHRLRIAAMAGLLGLPAETKFPTEYDQCWAGALERLLAPWRSVELIPFYRGAPYLSPFRRLQRAYLAYENLAARRNTRNLATHYLIAARC